MTELIILISAGWFVCGFCWGRGWEQDKCEWRDLALDFEDVCKRQNIIIDELIEQYGINKK